MQEGSNVLVAICDTGILAIIKLLQHCAKILVIQYTRALFALEILEHPYSSILSRAREVGSLAAWTLQHKDPQRFTVASPRSLSVFVICCCVAGPGIK